MATSTITALTAVSAGDLDDTTLLAVDDNDGHTRKITFAQLRLALPTLGLKFPAVQVPNADANTLDDYEEGTWTPTLAFSTSGSVTYNATFTGANSGRYTKAGRLVHVQCIIALTAVSSPLGNVTITGLPFAPAAGSTNYLACSLIGDAINAAITSSLMGRVDQALGAINIYKAAAGALAAFQGTDLTATTLLYLSATYTV